MHCYVFLLFIVSLRAWALATLPPGLELHHSVHLIKGEWVEAEVDLTLPGIEDFGLQRIFFSTPRSLYEFSRGWHFNIPDFGEAEIPRRKIKPPAEHLFNYTYDEQKRLTQVELLKEGKRRGSFDISYSSPEFCEVRSSAGDSCRYYFSPSPLGGSCLRRVETAKGSCEYFYKLHPKERKLLLTERREKGNWIKLIYSDKGELQELQRSSDEGRSFAKICTFAFTPGMSSVQDLRGATSCYYYNQDEQIIRIETWVDKLLYRTQEMEWLKGQCIRKTDKNSQGEIVRQERWKYNAQGNITEEILEGVLTKEGASLEAYAKRYHYDAHGLLIEEEEDNGKRTLYSYTAEGRLSTSCECEGDLIFERHFYTYDPEGRLSEEWKDDGTVITFVKTLAFHPYGYPLEQIKGYLAAQQEVIQEQLFFQYDERGHLIKKSSQKGWTSYQYDAAGQLLETTNAEGQLTQYFEGGKREFNAQEETISHYTADGKLLLEEIYQKGVCMGSLTYTYDPFGQLTSQTDQGGHTTLYCYDALGRKIEEVLPAVPDEQGNLHFPRYQYQYDSLDRMVATIDPLGALKSCSYNVRGEPFTTLYPDGTIEHKEYNLKGFLIKEVARNNTYQLYKNDCLGRVTHQSSFDADHQLLDESFFCYKGNQLTKESFSSGLTILHTYDEAGNLSASCSSSGRMVHFIYDTNNQLIGQREKSTSDEWLESEIPKPQASVPNDDRSVSFLPNCRGEIVLHTFSQKPDGSKTITIHDALGRPEQIEKRSPLGELLYQRNFCYDLASRKIRDMGHTVEKGQIVDTITHAWIYNVSGQLQEQIEALGRAEERKTTYRYNALGQLIEIFKPDGVALKHSYNAAGKLVHFFSSDSSFDYLFEYDAGQVITVIDLVHGSHSQRRFTLEGQLAYEKLGNGLELENSYDLLGRRTAMTLPDGTQVTYHFDKVKLKSICRENKHQQELYRHTYLAYDSAGRPCRAAMIGNLGEISYLWSQEGRCMAVSSPYFSQEAKMDAMQRVVQLISQDPRGRYESQFSYDPLGQLQAENAHNYQWDSLESMRNHEQQTKYDLNGNLVEKGNLTFAYDALNRLIVVEQEGKMVHSYVYDAWHRRISDGKERFLYDGMQEIGSYDQEASPNTLRIFGLMHPSGYQECIALELNGTAVAPLCDLAGSVTTLVSLSTQQPVAWYRYTAFGECTAYESSLANPWRYANKRYDPHTGFLFFGRRDYDPALCCWISLDPAGFADGFNRYAYLHNDPLNNRDLYGLKSISEHWDEFKTWAQGLLKSFGAYLLNLFKKTYTMGFVDHLLEQTVGRGFLIFMGHIKTDPLQGVYGKGEVNDKVRVSFMNGVLVDYSDLMRAVQGLSHSHGNVNVHYIYRPTQGWIGDILFGALVKGGHVSKEAHTLAKEWRHMIDAMGGVTEGGTIIHYAHSMGSAETQHALKLLSPEERQMIYVYSFGSPALSTDHAQTYHYLSVRDAVPLLDTGAFFAACSGKLPNVRFVGSPFGLPLIDHLFFSETYQGLWKSMGRTFTDWYGAIP